MLDLKQEIFSIDSVDVVSVQSIVKEYMALGEYQQVKTFLSAILNYDGVIESRIKSTVYLYLSECLFALQQYEECEQVLGEAISIFPRGHNLYKVAARNMVALSNNEAAIKYYRQYVEIRKEKTPIKLTREFINCLEESGLYMEAERYRSDFGIGPTESLVFDKAMVSFSYDDGKYNNYAEAMPLHLEYDITGTFYIITSRLVGDKHKGKFMNFNEVVEAFNSGFEIGSHTVSHNGTRLTDLQSDDLNNELSNSKVRLESMISENIDSVAIPYSRHNDYVINKASKLYNTIRVAGNKFNSPCNRDTIVITSHHIEKKTTFNDIKKLIDDAVASKKWLVFMLHGVTANIVDIGKYDCQLSLLEQTFKYIQGLGKDKILPVTVSDGSHISRERFKFLAGGEESETDTVPVKGKVIADHDDYRITVYKQNFQAKNLVIGFGGLPSKINSPGFGKNLFLKKGYDYIAVAQRERTQYQGLSLEKFYEVVSPWIKNKKVFTYGSSLGAYCALYYGGIIDAQIISSAPKNSAHPKTLKKSFKDLEWNHLELIDVPKSILPPIIIHDPFRSEEKRYIEEFVLPAYSEARHIVLPFWGHTVLNTMKHSGVVSTFITEIIKNDNIIELEISDTSKFIENTERANYLYKLGDYPAALTLYKESFMSVAHFDSAKGILNSLKKMNFKSEFELFKDDISDSSIDAEDKSKLNKIKW